jgi:hypothetical protein
MASSQQQGLDEAEKSSMKEENQKKEENEKEQNEEEKEEHRGIHTDIFPSRQALGGLLSMAPDAAGSMSTGMGQNITSAIRPGPTNDAKRLASEPKETNTSLNSVTVEDTQVEQDLGMDLDEESSAWSPALPIHALTCDDQAGTGRTEEDLRREREEESEAAPKNQVAQRSPQGFHRLNADTVGAGSEKVDVPLVPPPQGSTLANLLRDEIRPAQPSNQNAAADEVAASNKASASASSTMLPTSTSMASPPRPFLPLQPTGSLFERRILPPPRAPHAPPFERRATVGSDLLSDTRRDPWYPSNLAMQPHQPSGALFGNYEIAPLTPGVGVMMPMDLGPGGSTSSWDRPRPTSSPGPSGGPILREPHRRRGSVHLPGLSNSNPARSYGSLSSLMDTRTLGEHRRRASAEQRVHAFSPYRGAGAGAATGARSRGLAGSWQTMSPGSETEDPFQQVSLPAAGLSGNRPSVLESRLPGGLEESDEPGRRPNLAGKSVKSTRMGMACIICRKR